METNHGKGHNPLAVSNYFIKNRNVAVDKGGIPLMKLIKLCYFAHGFKLAITNGEILIDEYAEAWKYGPVFPSIFHEFKNKRLINELAIRYNLDKKRLEYWDADFSDIEKSIMTKTIGTFGKHDGLYLSKITHEQNSPWSKAWEKGKHIRGFSIKNDDIKDYFKDLKNNVD